MKILVTGSIAYDLLLNYEGSFADAIDPAHLHELSMAFVTPRFARHHGGTAANIAWNLRLLHQDSLLVGTVGNDGGSYVELLRERGVAVENIEKIDSAASSTAIVATDKNERQITFYHPGADSKGTWPEKLSDDRDDISFAIISPRDARLMMEAVQWCITFGIPYLFDPGQQVLALSRDDLLKAIHGSRGVITNAYEWQLLSERTGFSTDALLTETHLLIITHGEAGLTLYTPKDTIVLHACRAEKVVNPTGAGDALRAGILTGLAAGWPLKHCGQLGAAMGSFVVEHEGTLLDFLDINDVIGRAEVTYGEALPEFS
jgi:adenosine kinase